MPSVVCRPARLAPTPLARPPAAWTAALATLPPLALLLAVPGELQHTGVAQLLTSIVERDALLARLGFIGLMQSDDHHHCSLLSVTQLMLPCWYVCLFVVSPLQQAWHLRS